MSFMGNMTGNKALTAHSKGDYRTALTLYEEAYEKATGEEWFLSGSNPVW